jgi:pimeloyl-ACP methyl ester carboxylesterase
MKRISLLFSLLLICIATAAQAQTPAPKPWSDPSPHKVGFVTANGVRLNYLDWGGTGPALILIHGIGDNPHIFDDLAPAFTGSFHVIAYARRGHGESEAKGPYDTATLTEDLRGLMDALGIAKASLVGWSMGGNEITEMAGTYPERVERIVYLDGAYDFGDPTFTPVRKAFPSVYSQQPATVRASLEAWRTYQKNKFFAEVRDAGRFEAYVRELVVIQPDGTVRDRMREDVAQAVNKTLFSDRRDYTKVHCPALAIYAETMPDTHHGDPARIAAMIEWEQKYMGPFRASSMDRVRRELHNVEIVKVSGTHIDFVFTSRKQVVAAMRRFLSGTPRS